MAAYRAATNPNPSGGHAYTGIYSIVMGDPGNIILRLFRVHLNTCRKAIAKAQ